MCPLHLTKNKNIANKLYGINLQYNKYKIRQYNKYKYKTHHIKITLLKVYEHSYACIHIVSLFSMMNETLIIFSWFDDI